MKRLIAGIVVVALISIGLGVYYLNNGSKEVGKDPIDAIPSSAAIIVAYPRLASSWSALTETDYYGSIQKIDEFQTFLGRYDFVDSVLTNDEEVRSLFETSTIWVSYHPNSEGQLQVLHVIRPLKERARKVQDLMTRLLDERGTATQEDLGEQTMTKVVFDEPEQTVYYTFFDGLLLVGSTESIIRESHKNLLDGTSFLKDPFFRRALESSGKNVDADIFINYGRLPDHLALYLKPGITATEGVLGTFASWTELDLNIKDEGFSLNGFSYTNDTLPQYLNIFLNQKPQSISFPDILPSNTASFVFFGIEDILALSSDYRKLLDGFGKLNTTDAKLDSLNEFYEVDIESSFLSWIGNEFGICITEPSSVGFAENSYAIFKARSSTLAEKLLGDLVNALDKKKGIDSEVVMVDSIAIRKLNLADVLPDLLGPGFEQLRNPYYAIFKDHVIFGASSESVQSFLHNLSTDRTLGRELAFSEFAENLGSNFNIYTYHHISRSKHILESYLNTRSAESLHRNEKQLKSFDFVGTQISSAGESFYSSVFLKFNSGTSSDDQTSWSGKLDTLAHRPPVFVRNHLTNDWEVLVQDKLNSLYLFDRFGQEIFKIAVAEPILNRPVQVDAFKNGNLQYVFNTRSYIYMIDRNGELVRNFPIELSSPAETELSVIEYDKRRDYRLLITCKNKHIYNYDIHGKQVTGWKHNKASDPTVHPFQHLVTGGKDYLVTGETNGKIHLLDRRGKNRVTVEERIKNATGNQLQVFASTQQAFRGVYLTDKTGLIWKVSLDGKVSEMSVGKFSDQHRFLVSDLNNDGRPEFIFTDLNMLRVYNYKRELVFETRLDPSASDPFIVAINSQSSAIGVCFKDPEQLLMYNYDGTIYSGFPLSGSSEFDLVIDKNKPLIVSTGSGPNILIQALQ